MQELDMSKPLENPKANAFKNQLEALEHMRVMGVSENSGKFTYDCRKGTKLYMTISTTDFEMCEINAISMPVLQVNIDEMFNIINNAKLF